MLWTREIVKISIFGLTLQWERQIEITDSSYNRKNKYNGTSPKNLANFSIF
jgi:hypothetical protein